MTVCVATIADGRAVLGATDRMITAGNVQFEPPMSKIRLMTTSIVMMVAGDSEVQEEVLQDVRADVKARLEADANSWIPVRQVAEWYSKRRSEARNRRAERQILAPLGLNYETYLERQDSLAPALIEKIAGKLVQFEGTNTEAIVAGLDDLGPHIYVCSGSLVRCRDGVGFAAIGAGAWHAESQLMFHAHTGETILAEALLNTHLAKKRAEVAPGVGSATDMFFVGSLGGYVPVGEHIHAKLRDVYERHRARRAAMAAEERGEMHQYVQELFGANNRVQDAVPETWQPQVVEAEGDSWVVKRGDGDNSVSDETQIVEGKV